MKKIILISIALAWAVYFVLPFEAPALSYFLAAGISPLLMKYVKDKYEVYIALALALLLIVLQGYIVAGMLIGVITSTILKTRILKKWSAKITLSNNKKILSLVSLNAIIVVSVFVEKFMNGGF